MGDMPGMPGMKIDGGSSGSPAADGDGVVMVPRAAIVRMAGMPEMVWVLNQQTSSAEMRHVRLGAARGEDVEVIEGLRPGDRVIVNPSESIKEGAKVRVK